MRSDTPLNILVGGQTHLHHATRDLDQSLSRLLGALGHRLNTRCGEHGTCDGCVIELAAGHVYDTRLRETVSANGTPVSLHGCACRLHDDQPVAIRIPDRSLATHKPQIVSHFKINIPFANDPLPHPGDRPLGAAVDIGTTTVALLLIDLKRGRVLARALALNEQIHGGDNVLTRINLCRSDPAALHNLQRAVIDDTILPLLDEALHKSNQTRDRVGVMSLAGNTTMLHLFAGVDPSPMGVVPFTPVFLEHRQLKGDTVGMVGALADISLHLLPGAAAYIGADLCAGMIASSMAYAQRPTLLIDIGTNGEIILKHGDRLMGCSTAAGPAFEGASLASGMRAAEGAISHVHFDKDRVTWELIDDAPDAPPRGICGSAYVDLLAEGRRVGLLGETGRLDPAHPGFGQCVLPHVHGWALRLTEGRDGKPVLLAEADIAALLQAKAAIAAGLLTLLERADLEPEEVETVYLAGGFGLHVDVRNAIACGLLPGFRPEQVHVVGNTSLAGAYLALIDQHLIDEMARYSRDVQIVELNLDPDFESRFIDQLALPHPAAPNDTPFHPNILRQTEALSYASHGVQTSP